MSSDSGVGHRARSKIEFEAEQFVRQQKPLTSLAQLQLEVLLDIRDVVARLQVTLEHELLERKLSKGT